MLVSLSFARIQQTSATMTQIAKTFSSLLLFFYSVTASWLYVYTSIVELSTKKM